LALGDDFIANRITKVSSALKNYELSLNLIDPMNATEIEATVA